MRVEAVGDDSRHPRLFKRPCVHRVRVQREQQLEHLRGELLAAGLGGDLLEPGGEDGETRAFVFESQRRELRLWHLGDGALAKGAAARRRLQAGHHLEHPVERDGVDGRGRPVGAGGDEAEHPLHLLLAVGHLLLLPRELFHPLLLLLLQAPAHALASLLVILRAVLAVDASALLPAALLRLHLLLLLLLLPAVGVVLVVRVVGRSGYVRIFRIIRPRDVLEGDQLEHLVEGKAGGAVHDVQRVPRRAPPRQHGAADGVRMLLARVLPREEQATAARLFGATELVVIVGGCAHSHVRVAALRVRIGSPARYRHLLRRRHVAGPVGEDASQDAHRGRHQRRLRLVARFHRLGGGSGDERDEDARAAARLLEVPEHEHAPASADGVVAGGLGVGGVVLARGAEVIDVVVPEGFFKLHHNLVEAAETESLNRHRLGLGQPRDELDVAGFETAQGRGHDARAPLDRLAVRRVDDDAAGVALAPEVLHLFHHDLAANLQPRREGVRYLAVPASDHAVRAAESAVRLVLVPVRHGYLREGRGAPVLEVCPVPPQQPPLPRGERHLLPLLAVLLALAGSIRRRRCRRRRGHVLAERLLQLVLDHLRQRHLRGGVVALPIHPKPRAIHQRVPVPLHPGVQLIAHELAGDAVVQRELVPERLEPQAELRGDRGGRIGSDAEPRQSRSPLGIRGAPGDDGRAHVHWNGQRRAIRVHAPADAIARLKDDAGVPVRREHASRRETRGARADDDHRLGGLGLGGFDLRLGLGDGRLGLGGVLAPLLGALTLTDVPVLVRVFQEPGDDGANHEFLFGEIGAEFGFDRLADLFLGCGVHVRGAKVRDGALREELVRDRRRRAGVFGLGVFGRRFGLGRRGLGRRHVDRAVVDGAVLLEPGVRFPREVGGVRGHRREASLDRQRGARVFMPHLEHVVPANGDESAKGADGQVPRSSRRIRGCFSHGPIAGGTMARSRFGTAPDRGSTARANRGMLT